MKEWIALFLQLIGFAVVVSTVLIGIRIIFDKYIRGAFCEHKYTVQGRLKQGEKMFFSWYAKSVEKEKMLKYTMASSE